ncbi:MAG: glycosyltransferase [Pseudomonas sp.]|nr:glycosyltransferase [Pseudomonas sp.]
MGFEFQEFGHAFYLLYSGKARVLPIPYVVRELNYGGSEHGTFMQQALISPDQRFADMRRDFLTFAVGLLAGAGDESASAVRQFLDQSLRVCAHCLDSNASLTVQEIFSSKWPILAEKPEWTFKPTQFVEMPFYNREFFTALESIDFLLRTIPVGKLQKQQLEAVFAEQDAVLLQCDTDNVKLRQSQLSMVVEAFRKYPFRKEAAVKLRELLSTNSKKTPQLDNLEQWISRIENAPRFAGDSKLLVAQGGTQQLVRDFQTPIEDWLAARELTATQRQLVNARFAQGLRCSLAVFILDVESSEGGIEASLASLQVEELAGHEVKVTVLTDKCQKIPSNLSVSLDIVEVGSYVEALNRLAGEQVSDWLLVIRSGVEFTASGLHMLATELAGQLPCDAIYTDELIRKDNGTLGGLFRPDFNLDMLLSLPSGMARHWLFRRKTFLELGGFDPGYPAALELDLIVRLVEKKGMAAIGHLDEPLLIADSISLLNIPDEVCILERHLQRRGYPNGKVVADLPGRYRLIYNHDDKPLVSIIVPTKDQLPMLLRCITSLLEKTRYPNFEVLIVDNNSETAEARDWLNGVAKMGADKVRVLRYPHPFNYSAINNMAAREARGEYLVLLNNDTAILREDWLEALMNHGQRPEVGIVGAKLLYPTGQIQHAGVILGLRGPADHPFIGAEQTESGYMQRMQVDQNLTAVTAACLLIRKSIYEDVGGLDEEAFKVSYNDVDLCLKVREAGYLTVWTPHSVVMHVGSVSQNNVDPAKAEAKRKRFIAEQDAMYEKWLPLIARDPAYNANLSLNGKGFEIEVDANLTWRPLSWRPLPVVLAHMADKTGCGQYRVIQPFNAAKEAGLIDGTLSGRLLSIPELERYNPDSIVLQRQVTDAQLEIVGRMNKFSKAFKVFELDDYLPNLPIKSVHRGHIPKDILKSIRRGLGYVDRFVVSTEPLAEAFAGMHADIQVVKNRLDPRWWTGLSSERRVSDKPRVGWAGGSSHTGDLEMIADVVKELANEVEWVFFGMCPDKLRPYVHEFHPGIDIEKYPAALAGLNLDLALAPVEPNLFNECKSNLRLLEYGACGFPVVCTDLVCYQGDLPVTRVKNRFKDWVDAIRMHLSDLDATAKTGDELRAAVHKDWMLEGENLELWRKAWLPG